jgi:hypothetical protein
VKSKIRQNNQPGKGIKMRGNEAVKIAMRIKII